MKPVKLTRREARVLLSVIGWVNAAGYESEWAETNVPPHIDHQSARARAAMDRTFRHLDSAALKIGEADR